MGGVVFLVTIVARRIVFKLGGRFTELTDGFYEKVIINFQFGVTIIGSWIGMREISWEPIQNSLAKKPFHRVLGGSIDCTTNSQICHEKATR